MYATERHGRITSALNADGRVSVAQLARDLGVTSETIRRDLDQLEAAGLLRRVHGGAVAAGHGSTSETSVSEREGRNHEAKRRVAQAALALIPAGFRGSILLDAGSTTAEIASLIAARDARTSEGVTYISNSVPIIARLAAGPSLEVIALGGRVRGVTSAAVGPATVSQLRSMRPDLAFLGTNGVSAEFGLSTPDADEAAVKTQMVHASRRTIVVTDASKFEEETLTRFAELSEIDTLVTDDAPPAPLSDALREAGVEVVTAR